MEKVQDYIIGLQQTLEELPLSLIEEVITVLHETRLSGRQIFIMGNGGSASTASHFVADLAKNTRKNGFPNFKAIGLADNMAIFSAYANDEGYENVFAQQLASLVCPMDIVIAISASGNSPNVLRAVETARQYSAFTIGFTGFDGGRLGSMVDIHIHVPSHTIEHVEDIHLMMEHLITMTLRNMVQKPDLPSWAVMVPTPVTSNLKLSAGVRLAEIQNELAFNEQNWNYLDLLKSLTRQIEPHLERSVLLQRILSLSMEAVGASSGSILIMDERGDVAEAALAYAGKVNSQISGQLCDVFEQGLVHWVIENRQATLVSSTRDDPRWLPREWEKEENTSRSAISVPIIVQDRVVGVLTLVHPQTSKFTRDDLVFLTAIAVCVSFSNAKVLV